MPQLVLITLQIRIYHLSEFVERILKCTYYLIILILIFARKKDINHVAKAPGNTIVTQKRLTFWTIAKSIPHRN